MKQNLKYIALFAFAALALAGCKNEDLEQHHYDNKLFISGTKFTDELLVKASTTTASRDITVGIAKPETHDIAVSLKVAPELLDTYRKAYYDEAAVLLPEKNYAMAATDTKIQAGSVVSTPLTLQFVDLNELDRDTRYVLPVTIASVTGIDALSSARSLYYIFKGAALINVVADIAGSRVWPDWKKAAPVTNMEFFTLEALVYGNKFNKQISTLMGIEGKFLVRFGDAGVDPNQLQVASRSNLTNGNLKFDANKWYHVAVTFATGAVKVYVNGVEKLSGNAGVTTVNFGVAHSNEDNGLPRCFWIGYSYNDDRDLDGRISEVRIWNKALSAAEINAAGHFYEVDPASSGLVAYWKFDEGAGAVIKDKTSNGNDLSMSKMPKWTPVSLPEKN